MSVYDYEHFVRDFIKRTKANLKIINDIEKKKTKDKEVYEVTQLVNSLFGLLIVPFEHFKFGSINGVSEYELSEKIGYAETRTIIEEIESGNHWRNDYLKDGIDKDEYKVSNFIKHLRNALAHLGNERVLFVDDEVNENGKTYKKLVGIIFYDTDEDFKKEGEVKHEFCVELDLKNIQKLVDSISLMYSNVFKKKNNDELEYSYKIDEKLMLINGGKFND